MGDQPCGADATVFAFVAGFFPRVRNADQISGGKAPKSCRLPRPHLAALFPGIGSKDGCTSFLLNKIVFGQLTDKAVRVWPRLTLQVFHALAKTMVFYNG